MRTGQQTAEINRYLQSHGLGVLSDPGAVSQIGFMFGMTCKTHEHLRTWLNRCEPAERRNMYEALKPYLSFPPKPLDVYIAELADLADRKQLPVVTEDGGLRPHRSVELKTGDLLTAQRVIEEVAARKHLTLVCGQCTKEETFPGFFKSDCVEAARAAGWQHRDAKEYCANCVTSA